MGCLVMASGDYNYINVNSVPNLRHYFFAYYSLAYLKIAMDRH